mmetsp:Transcript_47223/g.102933  ORF Transcript_47223/g.102933 Transcript_47223/m.102933 type:complete len:202 (+) Transcript_47223:1188-1793(+)
MCPAKRISRALNSAISSLSLSISESSKDLDLSCCPVSFCTFGLNPEPLESFQDLLEVPSSCTCTCDVNAFWNWSSKSAVFMVISSTKVFSKDSPVFNGSFKTALNFFFKASTSNGFSRADSFNFSSTACTASMPGVSTLTSNAGGWRSCRKKVHTLWQSTSGVRKSKRIMSGSFSCSHSSMLFTPDAVRISYSSKDCLKNI